MARVADTFRAARRNAQRGFVWHGARTGYSPYPAPKGHTYRPNGEQECNRRRRRLTVKDGRHTHAKP